MHGGSRGNFLCVNKKSVLYDWPAEILKLALEHIVIQPHLFNSLHGK